MDSRNGSREKAKAWISERRNKALLIAVGVLVTLVVLQVGNQPTQKLMSPLFADCNLRSKDLQRMQIAISKAGLSEFEVVNNQLLVPQHQTAQYLQAISEHNAMPAELQDKSPSSGFANPFLTHSQQLSLERQSRNEKLQEMLMLLPFVEQAWFEMDEAGSRSGLQAVPRSAVVTIRPKLKQPLLEQQVYTISQLVCGAITGLNKDRIVIVDLTTGFAHQGCVPCEGWEQRLQAQRVAYNRQQHLENRLREALGRFEGLKVSVLVEAVAQVNENQTASLPTTTADLVGPVSVPNLPTPAGAPPQLAQANCHQELVQVGANGQASILAADESVDAPDAVLKNAPLKNQIGLVQLTTHASPEPLTNAPTSEHVTIIVDVPEQLLLERFGKSSQLEYQPSRIADSQHERTRVFQRLLEQLKPELDRTIQAVLKVQGLTEVPVVYNLVANETAPASATWAAMVRATALENWPSLGVLFTGLVLIALITSRGREFQRAKQVAPAEEPSTIRMSMPSSTAEEECISAKAQLSQMIEKDPDAAARVIENWIRNAA